MPRARYRPNKSFVSERVVETRLLTLFPLQRRRNAPEKCDTECDKVQCGRYRYRTESEAVHWTLTRGYLGIVRERIEKQLWGHVQPSLARYFRSLAFYSARYCMLGIAARDSTLANGERERERDRLSVPDEIVFVLVRERS